MLEYVIGKNAKAHVWRPHPKRFEIVLTGRDDYPVLSDKRMAELMKLLDAALRQI